MNINEEDEDEEGTDFMDGFDNDLDGGVGLINDDEEHDMMLDGGMHLMGGVKKPNCLFDDGSGLSGLGGVMPKAAAPANDCVTKVASECFDLNQFICKMDELVY